MAVNSVSIQLKWDSFRVVVGPGVISIFAAIPYVGWEEFSKAINKILKTVLETEQVTRIERYSIKYANILNSKDFPKGLDALNLKLNLGDFVLNNEQAQIRLEIQMESYLTIFTLSSVVNMQYPGGAILEGVLIDIDTINKNPISDIVNFKNELPNLLNDIHAKNKTFFFKTLKRETIQALGPSYDN